MRFTAKEESEIGKIINIPEIVSILIDGQLCLYSGGLLNTHNLSRVLDKAIRRELNQQQIKLSLTLSKKLPAILQEMLNFLVTQKRERSNYVIDILLKGYQKNYNSEQLSLALELHKLVKASAKRLDYKNSFSDNKLTLDSELLSVLDNLQNYISHEKRWKPAHAYLGIGGMLYCAYLGVNAYCDNPVIDSFQIRNTIFFIGGALYYKYLSKFLNDLFLNCEKQHTLNGGLPTYRFDLIKIVECESYQTMGNKIGACDLESVSEDSEASKTDFKNIPSDNSVAVEKTETTHNLRAKHKVRFSLQKFFIPKPLQLQLSWPGDSVILSSETAIDRSETSYIEMPFLSRKTIFWAFFNKPALKEQKLSERDVEWQDYKTTLEKPQFRVLHH